MARRIMLNGTSYFGQGAIQEIVNEIKNRHFKKALVTSTPDLFEFKVVTKVTDLLDAAGISLSEAGVKREDIPFLAESAFNDACTPGNPRDASLEEIIGIYESIF